MKQPLQQFLHEVPTHRQANWSVFFSRMLVLGLTVVAFGIMYVGADRASGLGFLVAAIALAIAAQLAEIAILSFADLSRSARRTAFHLTGLVHGLALGLAAWTVLPSALRPEAGPGGLLGWLLYFAATGSFIVSSRWSAVAFALLALAGVGAGLFGAVNAPDTGPLLATVVGLLCITIYWAWRQHEMRLGLSSAAQRAENAGLLTTMLLEEGAEGTQNWTWRTDAAGRILQVSSGFERATGLSPHEAIGIDLVAFVSTLQAAATDNSISVIARSMGARQPFHNVELHLEVEGETLYWKMSGAPVRDEYGEVTGFVGANFDITKSKHSEQAILELAHYDSLTGLLNRGHFNFHLEHLVARLERYGAPFSLMLMDLDHFKNINDSLGHPAGDSVLADVAKRLRRCVRESDFCARLGGDEFAVLFPGLTSRQELEHIADRLMEEMALPFEWEGARVFLGSSVGIVVAPMNGTRPAQLLRNADLALYRAKGQGRGDWKFFETRMDSEVRERRLLESELKDAVRNGQIELYFQPLVDASTGVPTAFEALVRWNHPLRGVVPPAEFIPVAEETGAIVEIGDWTINEACRVAKTWPAQMKVAVNLSPRQFSDSDIISVVQRALRHHDLPSDRLELEITEGVLMAGADDLVTKLEELKRIGVTIAMDDFGTGYSSLSYLLKFPFDKIKIDKSFVDRVPNDQAAQRILRAMASLGHSLKMTIVAEGVESEAQAKFLSAIACQELQGFFFSKPVREMELGALLPRLAKARAVS